MDLNLLLKELVKFPFLLKICSPFPISLQLIDEGYAFRGSHFFGTTSIVSCFAFPFPKLLHDPHLSKFRKMVPQLTRTLSLRM